MPHVAVKSSREFYCYVNVMRHCSGIHRREECVARVI